MAERGQRPPTKWRALSWVIIDVDAFLLGFGVGSRSSPATSSPV